MIQVLKRIIVRIVLVLLLSLSFYSVYGQYPDSVLNIRLHGLKNQSNNSPALKSTSGSVLYQLDSTIRQAYYSRAIGS